jgi:serine/threonine protein kinase/Tol biopolymer transport system component
LAINPGTRLGPYEIESALGAGGMGEVYRARDTRLDRVVAIKVLPFDVAADPQRRERFDREARTISSLNHPHICTLYDVGHQEGIGYLVMELLEGQTLGDRLARGALPIDQALQYASQILEALDAAHRRGIVHRDLKPANIFLARGGGSSRPPIAKLLDFGIAKTVPSGTAALTAPPLTAEGTLLGTLQYMAPEQLEGREADARSDLFAFGAVLYEMLTGRRAFPGQSQSKVIAAVLDSEPPAIATIQPLTPPALDHLVTTCLAKHPDERWQSASDVKRQLEWIALSMAKPAAAEPHPDRGVRVRRNAVVVASLVTLVIGSVLAWALWKPPSAAPILRETRLEISTPPTLREASLAISPDGLTVAFVGESDGQSVLWLRPLNGAARPVAGTVGAVDPFWSPDNQSLGFFADGKLKRIDVKGGAAQTLAEALDPKGGTWNRDGTIIFTPHQISPLVRVAAAGGVAAAMTRLGAGHTGHLYPHVLSDGEHVLYYVTGGPDVQGVYVSTLDGTSPKKLLEASSPAVYLPTGYLLFVREGVLLAQALDVARLELTGDAVSIAERVAVEAFSKPAASGSTRGDIVYRAVAAGRALQLTWFDRSGKLLQQVGNPDSARTGGLVSLSPDGHRVAVPRALGGDKSDVWLLDLERGGVMSRLTLGGKEVLPLWSRDGQRVAYASTRNGAIDLYEKSVDAGHEDALLVSAQKKVPAEWSPDGRVLLYVNADVDTHLDIWALPIDPKEKPFPVVQSPFEDLNPQFGPDGLWLVYQSNVSNRYEVYVRPFQGPGAPLLVSTDGGTQPRLRRDGKELFYLGLDRWMMAVPLASSSDGRSVKAGAPVKLFQTKIGGPESGYSQRQYEVTNDGQRFLFDLSVEQSLAPIVVIQNWRP